jgi:hypothetical protein
MARKKKSAANVTDGGGLLIQYRINSDRGEAANRNLTSAARRAQAVTYNLPG